VFCEAKNAPNSFSAGARNSPPRAPPEDFTWKIFCWHPRAGASSYKPGRKCFKKNRVSFFGNIELWGKVEYYNAVFTYRLKTLFSRFTTWQAEVGIGLFCDSECMHQIRFLPGLPQPDALGSSRRSPKLLSRLWEGYPLLISHLLDASAPQISAPPPRWRLTLSWGELAPSRVNKCPYPRVWML